MIRLRTALLLSLAGLATACPPKNKKPLEAATESGDAADSGSKLPEPTGVSQANIDTLHRNFRKVFFEFDRADLGEDDRAVLNENAKILTAHPTITVQLQGHTDDYGSEEYNLALGEKRAQSVRDYLVDLGVPEKQLKLVSYGEEKPLADGDKTDQATNRRAEFVVLVGGEVVGSSDQ